MMQIKLLMFINFQILFSIFSFSVKSTANNTRNAKVYGFDVAKQTEDLFAFESGTTKLMGKYDYRDREDCFEVVENMEFSGTTECIMSLRTFYVQHCRLDV
jgi:hypothetical protein